MQSASLALLQPGMAFFGSDNLQDIKGVLPFKVVAVGRFSELECALQSCHESAYGCDFEKKGVLTLKITEDGRVCWGGWQMCLFPGPARPCCPLIPLLLNHGNQGQG